MMTKDEQAAVVLLADLLPEGERFLSQHAQAGPAGASLGDLIGGGRGDERERVLSFLGNVLWEIFSDNNEVVGPDGEVYDLGSWRGSAGFIADVLNDQYFGGDGPFFYLDFYMGLMAEDVRLRPVYAHFFASLKRRGCTWRYAPPAIGVVSLAREEEDVSPEAYDPGAAIEKDLQQDEKQRRTAAFLQQLAKANQEAFDQAERHPPQIVLAYEDIYGERPPYLDHTSPKR